jgi:hypothetical protein
MNYQIGFGEPRVKSTNLDMSLCEVEFGPCPNDEESNDGSELLCLRLSTLFNFYGLICHTATGMNHNNQQTK